MSYKYWVIISAGLFIIGLGTGLVVSAMMPAVIVRFFTDQLAALGELASIIGPFEATTAVIIFFKNVSALIFSFVCVIVTALLTVSSLLYRAATANPSDNLRFE